MREPEDPSPGEATAFETRLLTAARTEQIPPALKQRMARALEMPATTSSAAGGASKALLSSKAWLTLSALVLVAMGGGWAARRAHVAAAPPRGQNALAIATSPVQVAIDEPATPPSDVALPAPLAEPATNVASPARTRIAKHEDGGDLRDEIALLDSARDAMKNGAPAQALGALDRYARRFSRGAFAPEAEALRIEALVRDGQSERARALGRRFLAQHPSSPLAERVERTLGAQGIN